MVEDESLCKYCDAECCEGAYCKEAYEWYLDELGISDRVVRIKNKTKVTIERD